MNFTKNKIAFFLLFVSLTVIVKGEIVQVKIFYDKDWVICKPDNVRLTRVFIENCPKYGYAYYEIVIDENGNIINKDIIRSPHKIITEIALESLNSIQQFKPAYNDGKPIKSKLTSRIKFERPGIIR